MPLSTANVFELPLRRPDEALVALLADADETAITQVYRLHHAEVRAYAFRMLGDDAAAEDVVHDTFVALPAAMSRFRGTCSFRTFVFAIAVNQCRQRIRSAARQRSALLRLKSEPPASPDTPETEVRRRRLVNALRRGLETLSVEHREAFTLCVVEERSSAEVSEVLVVPEGTVRSRVFYARTKLRAFLESEGFT